jgi:hypothetical protein
MESSRDDDRSQSSTGHCRGTRSRRTVGAAERCSSSDRQVHHRFVAGYLEPPNPSASLHNVRCNVQLGKELALGGLALSVQLPTSSLDSSSVPSASFPTPRNSAGVVSPRAGDTLINWMRLLEDVPSGSLDSGAGCEGGRTIMV